MLAVVTPIFGMAGIVASAYIYLVPARPAWNMLHTPVDFLLSAAVLGTAAAPLLIRASELIEAYLHLASTPFTQPLWPLATASVLWSCNQSIRLFRLKRSHLYEHHASGALLTGRPLRGAFYSSVALVALAPLVLFVGFPLLALAFALAAVIVSRYLFFVSVVPLNMALTFVRSVHA